jgi:DnaJ homolog subfamily C member 9
VGASCVLPAPPCSVARKSHPSLSPPPSPLSLQHPDKAGDDPEATKRFQALSYIHSILSDKAKRAVYDRRGKLEDVEDDEGGGDEEAAEMWRSYWREFFPPVTEEAVVAFEKEYRGW